MGTSPQWRVLDPGRAGGLWLQLGCPPVTQSQPGQPNSLHLCHQDQQTLWTQLAGAPQLSKWNPSLHTTTGTKRETEPFTRRWACTDKPTFKTVHETYLVWNDVNEGIPVPCGGCQVLLLHWGRQSVVRRKLMNEPDLPNKQSGVSSHRPLHEVKKTMWELWQYSESGWDKQVASHPVEKESHIGQ